MLDKLLSKMKKIGLSDRNLRATDTKREKQTVPFTRCEVGNHQVSQSTSRSGLSGMQFGWQPDQSKHTTYGDKQLSRQDGRSPSGDRVMVDGVLVSHQQGKHDLTKEHIGP